MSICPNDCIYAGRSWQKHALGKPNKNFVKCRMTTPQRDMLQKGEIVRDCCKRCTEEINLFNEQLENDVKNYVTKALEAK